MKFSLPPTTVYVPSASTDSLLTSADTTSLRTLMDSSGPSTDILKESAQTGILTSTYSAQEIDAMAELARRRDLDGAALDKRIDPLLNFHWRAIMPFDFAPDYVEAVSLPDTAIEAMPVHVGNSSIKLPGFVTKEGVSVTVFEDRLGSSLKAYKKWRDTVEKDGLYGMPIEYKKTSLFTFHDSKAKNILVCKVIDMWPTDRTPVEGESAQSGRITYTINFACDDIEWSLA